MIMRKNRIEDPYSVPIWNFSPADIIGWAMLILICWGIFIIGYASFGYVQDSMSKSLTVVQTTEKAAGYVAQFEQGVKAQDPESSLIDKIHNIFFGGKSKEDSVGRF